MGTCIPKDYCGIRRFTISITYAVSQPNSMIMQREGVPLNQEIRKNRTFESVETAASNKVTTKYKKWCHILWLLRKKENNESDK